MTTSGTPEVSGLSSKQQLESKTSVTHMNLLSTTTKSIAAHTHTHFTLMVLGTEGQVGGLSRLCPPFLKGLRKVSGVATRVLDLLYSEDGRGGIQAPMGGHSKVNPHKGMCSEATRHNKVCLFSLLAVLKTN